MKDIAIYGAGGWGREIALLIKRINLECLENWNFIGFFDDGINKGEKNEYGEVLGDLTDLNNWNKELAIICAIGKPYTVKNIIKKIINPLVYFPNIVAPDVLFYDKSSFKIGKGNLICSKTIVSCNVSIGNFNTFNDSITLGHDSKIGNFNSFMPGVKICGGCIIGDENFLGINSVLLQYKRIGNNTSIAAGSIIYSDTKDNFTYLGNPGRPMIKK